MDSKLRKEIEKYLSVHGSPLGMVGFCMLWS